MYGSLLFPDPATEPDWAALAIEMYGVRNSAAHPPARPKRALTMRDINRGQDLLVVLGRLLLLETAGLPRDVAVNWVTRGFRCGRLRDSQKPGGTL
jgi:hypothetical protein